MVGTGLLVVNDICYTAALGNAKISPVIYSEEERQIGVWTDGKPLYEKTFHSNTVVGSSDTLMVLNDTIPTGIDVVETIGSYDLEISGYHYVSSSAEWFNWYISNGSIYASQSLSVATPISNIATFTLRYTKSSDTAGSGI